jgi:hypothetical protein
MSYQSGASLYTLRQVTIAEFKLDLFGTSGPAQAVWDVGFLYGRVAKASYGFAAISGGIGIVGEENFYDGDGHRLGIPIDGQLYWTFSRTVGVGFTGFANLNSRKSFIGLMFCLQFGHLKGD